MTCIDLDDLVARFSKPVARLQLDMCEERWLAKLKLKKRFVVQAKEDSESEVEFVEGDFGSVK